VGERDSFCPHQQSDLYGIFWFPASSKVRGPGLAGFGTITLRMRPHPAVLQNILVKTFTQECEVLRFMVEVRKVNDLRDKADKYPVLTFFCDWLVHPVLSFKSAQGILKGLDDFIAETKRGTAVADKNITFIGPLVSFALLQKELAVFLSEHELDTSVVNGDEWFKFLSLYIDQIERAEIRSENPAKQGLKHIETITIRRSLLTLGAPAASDQKFNFRVVWTFHQGGKATFEIANELWSPKVPQGVPIPVLNEITEADGTVNRVPLKSDTFFGEKK
jgi:hypothetical protein